ncbi:MAG: hypothetical protein AAF384_17510 [Pseudomonadota bacterium]
MVYVFLACSLGVFVIALRGLKLVSLATSTIETAREAVATIQSSTLGEDEKERRIQRAGVQMFGAFFSLLLRFSACVILALIVVYLGIAGSLFSPGHAIEAAGHWLFIALATVATVAAFCIKQ